MTGENLKRHKHDKGQLAYFTFDNLVYMTAFGQGGFS